MKVLITGGLGFIGSNLCKYMIKEHSDFEITNVDKIGMGASTSNLSELQSVERYRFLEGNICDSNLVNRIVKKADMLINVAAETHVDRSIAHPKDFVKNNTLGPFTILEAIRKYNRKIRLTQVSTDEVYGEILEGRFSENAALSPSNPYSASKAAAEMFVLAYCKTFGINASITRCTNNFGPHQFPEKLIPKTTIRALMNLQIPVYGTGKNIRDWLFVQDHCEAIDRVLAHGEPGEIYNIGSGNEMPNIEIVKKILSILGKDESLISFVEDRPGHDVRYSLDFSKIRTFLGWKPKHSFKEAIEKTVAWYKNNEKWWKPLATKEVLSRTPWRVRGRK
jgi:dTDP-glucose 4,6-dehydratase